MQVKKYGSHSNTHPHVNNLSYEKNIEEIEKSNESVEEKQNNDGSNKFDNIDNIKQKEKNKADAFAAKK